MRVHQSLGKNKGISIPLQSPSQQNLCYLVRNHPIRLGRWGSCDRTWIQRPCGRSQLFPNAINHWRTSHSTQDTSYTSVYIICILETLLVQVHEILPLSHSQLRVKTEHNIGAVVQLCVLRIKTTYFNFVLNPLFSVFALEFFCSFIYSSKLENKQ